MMLATRSALVRPLILAAVVLASLFAHPAPAAAQGRCSCNSGCHQYPGQCVQRGAAGCDPGFAPFCGTRGDTCPNATWVSCDGACSCVRVPGGDAGVPDAATVDLGGVGVDRPVAADAAPRVDAPLMSIDAPTSDVVSSDRSVVPDAGATADRPPAAQDAGCVCPGGVCIDGVCVTARCRYLPELGFECAGADMTCRLIDGEAYCVPLCLGVTCAAGEFCDEGSAERCVRDECATRTCPAGTTCRHNQCGALDGGAAGDAVTTSADTGASGGGMTVDESGCGCRASGPGRAMSTAWWGVAALLFTIRRRKKKE